MNYIEIIGVILSSTVLSTIISSLFTNLTNRKKDYIENITKERKEWRDYLRKFISKLNKCQNIKEIHDYIQLLKVRLNPYGIVTNSILDDSFLWKYIDEINFNDISDSYLNEIKSNLSSLISCILKFDWERSKEEIKGNSEMKLLTLAIAISFLLYSTKHFLNGLSIESYHNFCMLFVFSTFINVQTMRQANKWKKKMDLVLCIIVVILIAIIFFSLYLLFVRPLSINDIFDWFIIINPYNAFAYSFYIRIIRYRNNVGKMVRTVMKIINIDKMPHKWKIFVKS